MEKNPTPPQSPSAETSSTSELPASLAALADEGTAPGAPSAAAGDQVQHEEPDIPTAEFLEGLLSPLAQLAPALHHGFAVKPITDREVKSLAVAYGALLDHYFPGGVSSWGPWGAACIVTLSVAGPRLMIPAPKPAPKPAATPPATPSAA